MKDIEWLGTTEFEVAGVRFLTAQGNYSLRTDAERIVILKNRQDLEQYAAVLAPERPRNMLEFGIFQGGSPALFTAWLELERFIGIDICEPVPAFDAFCAQHAQGQRIRNYYRTSQTDELALAQIVRAEFGTQGIDAIVDDASHAYRATTRTFELAFPYLKPGGLYVIEDWGWAHWPGSTFYRGKTSLSKLIMELTMTCASRSDLISEVRIFPSFAFIRKSPQAPQLSTLNLHELYRKRGIDLLGSHRLRDLAKNLMGRVGRGR
jgi:cephalosporin hydroxylase